MARETIPYQGITEDEFLFRIANDVIAYCEWYAEDGMYLPPEFSKDPAAWTQILRDIQAAMELIVQGADKNMLEGHNAELLYNGIEKFYQYIKYLWK